MNNNRGLAHFLLLFLVLSAVLIFFTIQFFSRDDSDEIGNLNTSKTNQDLVTAVNYEVQKELFLTLPEGHREYRGIIYTSDMENYAYTNFIMNEEIPIDDNEFEVILNGKVLGGLHDEVLGIDFMNDYFVFHTRDYGSKRYDEGGYEKALLNSVFDDDEVTLRMVNLETNETTEVSRVKSYVISEDRSTIAYVKANPSNKALSFHINDDADEGTYRDIHDLNISPDGKHYFYTGFIYDTDGNYTSPTILNGSPVENDSGNATADDEAWSFLMDERSSADLKRYGSAISRDGTQKASTTGKEGDSYAVLNGKGQPHYNRVYDPVFSNTGNTFSYRAKKDNGKIVVIINGRESSEYSAAQYPRFCLDTENYAFKAFYYTLKEGVRITETTYVVNGFEHEKYDTIYGGHFSEDCKEFKFLIKEGRDIFVVTTIL